MSGEACDHIVALGRESDWEGGSYPFAVHASTIEGEDKGPGGRNFIGDRLWQYGDRFYLRFCPLCGAEIVWEPIGPEKHIKVEIPEHVLEKECVREDLYRRAAEAGLHMWRPLPLSWEEVIHPGDGYCVWKWQREGNALYAHLKPEERPRFIARPRTDLAQPTSPHRQVGESKEDSR